MFRLILTAFAICLASTALLSARDTERIFTEANMRFARGNETALTDPTEAQEHYRQAILKYRLLLDREDTSPALHINLANAYFQTGQNGRAVLHYQRALSLDPTNGDAAHNLEYLRGLVVDELPPTRFQSFLGIITFWHRWPFSLRFTLFCIANTILWILVARLFFRRTNLEYAGITTAAALALLFGFSLLSTINRWDNSTDGVIVEREITARQGDGMIYANAFDSPLHTGTEFSLIEVRNEWLHVRLLNDDTCWLPADTVEMVREKGEL